jgi:murein DD-endopeptidase MepM/ murein hydrolase activator NlpD
MRITRVAFSFFAVGFVAGTFEQAAGLGDGQRRQNPSIVVAEASLASSVDAAAAASTVPSMSEPLAPAGIASEAEMRPPLAPERPLLEMGDGSAAEAVAGAFTRVAAVDEATRPEAASPLPKLRPFFAPPAEEPLVVPEPQPAQRPREFMMPIDKGRVTSTFNQGRYHPAIDLAAPLGTPVHATTRKQRVTFAGRRGGYGNLVVTRDANGRQHYYGHLHRILAGIGTLLEQGDLLGLLGSTGHSTGPHVHYEVRTSAGRHFNPATLLFPGSGVRAGYAWNNPRSPATMAASAEAAPVGARPGRVAARASRVGARTATRVRAGRATRHAARTTRRYARAASPRYVTRVTPRHATRMAARYGQPRPR